MLRGEHLSLDALKRRYLVFSRCQFPDEIGAEHRAAFMRGLLPWEHRLAAYQTDIGSVEDPVYHYKLEVTNKTPIRAKPIRMRPEEEAWLDGHLDELESKGVIARVLPHEQPLCVTPLLLVPGVQSG